MRATASRIATALIVFFAGCAGGRLLGTTSAKATTETHGVKGEANVVTLMGAEDNRPDLVWATVALPNSDQGEPNQVMTIGHNRAGTGGRQDNTRHSWHVALEREFYTGTHRQAEYYVQYVSDDGETTLRPFSANVRTDNHTAMVGLQGSQSWTSSAGQQTATYLENGQLHMFGSGARLSVSTGGLQAPALGTLSVTGGPVTTRAGGVDLTYLQATATPNIILGSTGNAASVYLDAGAGRGIYFRPDGASATYAMTAQAMTVPRDLVVQGSASFSDATPVTGSTCDEKLASLLAALDAAGLIDDQTTP